MGVRDGLAGNERLEEWSQQARKRQHAEASEVEAQEQVSQILVELEEHIHAEQDAAAVEELGQADSARGQEGTAWYAH